jgi:hypothetical protein
LTSLDFAPEDVWLKKIYTAKINNIEENQLHSVMADE